MNRRLILIISVEELFYRDWINYVVIVQHKLKLIIIIGDQMVVS